MSNRIKTSDSFANLLPASGDKVAVEMFQDAGLWHHMTVRDKKGKIIAVISAPASVVEERPEYFKFV